MLTQLQPFAAWAHPTAIRGSMIVRLQRPNARFASAAKCWAPITRRRCKRSKTSPTSDPPPLEHGQGAGGDDARAARGSECAGKEVERACDLATSLKYRFAGHMVFAQLEQHRPLQPLPATFLQIKSYWKRLAETPPPLLSSAHFLTPPVAVHPSHALFLFSCSPLPNAVRCNDARWSCPASSTCADDMHDAAALGSSKCVASDGSVVDAVVNVDPLEVAEMRDFGEFQ